MSPAALPPCPKVVPRAEAAARLAALRPGRRVVFTNGCFDILHPGHADLLAGPGPWATCGGRRERRRSVRRLKGRPPVNPVADRMFVLAALASTDW